MVWNGPYDMVSAIWYGMGDIIWPHGLTLLKYSQGYCLIDRYDFLILFLQTHSFYIRMWIQSSQCFSNLKSSYNHSVLFLLSILFFTKGKMKLATSSCSGYVISILHNLEERNRRLDLQMKLKPKKGVRRQPWWIYLKFGSKTTLNKSPEVLFILSSFNNEPTPAPNKHLWQSHNNK